MNSSRNNTIGIQFHGRTWQPLRCIPVDTEGESVYILRPRTGPVSDRLLCEIRVEETVKIVTLRSTYMVDNLTLYPLELVLVDANNKPDYTVQKLGESLDQPTNIQGTNSSLAPGRSYSVPIEAVTQHRLKIRPDSR